MRLINYPVNTHTAEIFAPLHQRPLVFARDGASHHGFAPISGHHANGTLVLSHKVPRRATRCRIILRKCGSVKLLVGEAWHGDGVIICAIAHF